VTRDCSAFGGMPWQAERVRDPRANHGRPIAYDQDPVERPRARSTDDRRHRSVLLVKANRDGLVLPRIVEHAAPIGREDELHSKPLGCFTERARLISSRCR
jgi:hypothetical protein